MAGTGEASEVGSAVAVQIRRDELRERAGDVGPGATVEGVPDLAGVVHASEVGGAVTVQIRRDELRERAGDIGPGATVEGVPDLAGAVHTSEIGSTIGVEVACYKLAQLAGDVGPGATVEGVPDLAGVVHASEVGGAVTVHILESWRQLFANFVGKAAFQRSSNIVGCCGDTKSFAVFKVRESKVGLIADIHNRVTLANLPIINSVTSYRWVRIGIPGDGNLPGEKGSVPKEERTA